MTPQAREICLKDVRAAHEWATRALADAERRNSPLATYALQGKRKRLADRYEMVKRGADADGRTPQWRTR